MPIGGHRRELRPYGLHLCPSCRANDHTACRPIHLRRVVLFCECPGRQATRAARYLLPCVKGKP